MANKPGRSTDAPPSNIIPFPARLGLQVTLGRFNVYEPQAEALAELIRLRIAELKLARFNEQLRQNEPGPNVA